MVRQDRSLPLRDQPLLQTVLRLFDKQVCRLACELFFSTETYDPLNSVAKLLYQLELFSQLWWRFRKPNSRSCLLTVHDRISTSPGVSQ